MEERWTDGKVERRLSHKRQDRGQTEAQREGTEPWAAGLRGGCSEEWRPWLGARTPDRISTAPGAALIETIRLHDRWEQRGPER